MPRFFFDIHHRAAFFRDTEGTECAGSEAVRQEAMLALPEIAKGKIFKNGDRQAYTVLVRDENNATVYTATLMFAGLWMGDSPIPKLEPLDE